jgi:hypothetical protein
LKRFSSLFEPVARLSATSSSTSLESQISQPSAKIDAAPSTTTASKDDKRHCCSDCGYSFRTPGMLRSVQHPDCMRVNSLTRTELIVTASTTFASSAMNALQRLGSRKTWKDTSIQFIGSASLRGRCFVVPIPDV